MIKEKLHKTDNNLHCYIKDRNDQVDYCKPGLSNPPVCLFVFFFFSQAVQETSAKLSASCSSTLAKTLASSGRTCWDKATALAASGVPGDLWFCRRNVDNAAGF